MTTVQTNRVSDELMASMNPKKDAPKSTADAAQDRFMTLLVAQMRSQDPLNPADNAQVTSQLAQLSTVTGIDKLNTTMQALMGSYQTSQTLQAASMIGYGVLVPGSDVVLQEGAAVLGVELGAKASSVKVEISDANGNLVRKIDLGEQTAGIVPFAWDGKDDAGKVAKDGEYTFKVTAKMGTENVEAKTLSFGTVTSVTTSAQGVKLNLPRIGEFTMADVRQIL